MSFIHQDPYDADRPLTDTDLADIEALLKGLRP